MTAFLLATAAKGLLVLGVTALAVILFRNRSAAIRHLVWFTGLATIVALPLLSAGLPSWRVLPAGLGGAFRPARSEPVVAVPVIDLPAPNPAPRSAAIVQPVPARRVSAIAAVPARAPVVAIGPSAVAISSAPVVAPLAPDIPAPVEAGWGPGLVLLVLWGTGMVAGLVWIAAGEIGIRGLGRRGSAVLSPEWNELVPEALEASGLARRVTIRESDDDIVPLTYGVFMPVVVLPAAAVDWPAAHRRDALLHELAHVRRLDALTDLLGRIAVAIHWFNPLAWLAIREARIEREHACDDAVLNAGAVPSRYAEELLSTAESMSHRVGLAAAGLGMARRSRLAERLRRVLDRNRARAPLAPMTALAAALGAALVAIPLAALAPQEPARPAAPPIPTAAPRAPAPTRPPRPAAPPAAPHQPAFPVEAMPAAPGEPPLSAPVPAVTAIPAEPPPPPAEPDLAPAIVAVRSAPAVLAAPSSTTAIPGAPAGGPSLQAGTICPRGNPNRARTVKLTRTMSITGQGNASDGKNHFTAWTGSDCMVVINVTGEVSFNAEETDVEALESGAELSITHEAGDLVRKYQVRSRNGRLMRSYEVDGEPAAEDAAFERWRAAVVLEYIRRSGYQAEARALRILGRDGVDGVLRELEQIPSDWAAGRYFTALLDGGRLDAGQIATVVREAGRSLESDYELGKVLATVPARHLEAASVQTAFVAAAGTIESDYEIRKVLSKTISRAAPEAPLALRLLEAAATIESDYELGTWLRELVGTVDPKAPAPEVVAGMVAATGSLESGYELANVLVAMIERGLVTDAHKPAFRRAIDRIDSRYERQRVLAALGQRAAEIE